MFGAVLASLRVVVAIVDGGEAVEGILAGLTIFRVKFYHSGPPFNMYCFSSSGRHS